MPEIAMIPTPGIGHLLPLIELAKRLVLQSDTFSVTFLIPADISSSKSQYTMLSTLPSSISHTFLPAVDISDLPDDTRLETQILHIINKSSSSLQDALHSLISNSARRLVAVIVDLFVDPGLAKVAQDVPVYMFYTSSAMSLCASFEIFKLDKVSSLEYRDWPEPVRFFPGCVPVYGADFGDSVQERKSDTYKHVMDMVNRYREADGILVNSFVELEPLAFKSLMTKDNDEELTDHQNIPPVYPVGPLIRSIIPNNNSAGSDHLCIRWLDDQPSGSVLYVSFGSGGTLSHIQTIELAYGLEMSGQRFIWVLKNPNDMQASSTYLNQHATNIDPRGYLPHGFCDRTSQIGLVVPFWAPQVQILNHGSTGGILTHCGWNSSLESIVNGVPMIAWPLFAEQSLNAVQLSEDLKVAMRVRPNTEGIVERAQIADFAKRLIGGEDGKLLTERMKILKSNAAAALDKRGSLAKNLAELSQTWKRREELVRCCGKKAASEDQSV